MAEAINCEIARLTGVSRNTAAIPPRKHGAAEGGFLGKMHEEFQMKMTRYSEPQIRAILHQAEGGVSVAELCREHGMMPLPGNGLPANHERDGVFSTSGGRRTGG